MITTAWIKEMIMHYEGIGYILVFAGPFLEGLTVPCPSMFIVFLAGAFLADSLPKFLLLITTSSLAYTIASLIPYYIGASMQNKIRTYIRDKYWNIFERLFSLHGDKIVCYTRPLWIGNLVSYFAGINKMKRGIFLLYTLLGILPWHVIVMATGCFFGSNIEAGIALFEKYSWLAVIILIGFFILAGSLKAYLEKKIQGKFSH